MLFLYNKPVRIFNISNVPDFSLFHGCVRMNRYVTPVGKNVN